RSAGWRLKSHLTGVPPGVHLRGTQPESAQADLVVERPFAPNRHPARAPAWPLRGRNPGRRRPT
ncbi:hypothetical protein, partial [Candidatus Amarolinea dominans]|uniref:hypothetical protein n=1 Tax=Candidatus Amarolinea dominans TaxID=3140696 RepID=UPI0031CCC2DC